jgi:hypothetical protein
LKLKVTTNAIRLGLGVLSKRLGIVATGIVLKTVVLSKKLAVELGLFVSFIARSDTTSAAESSLLSFIKRLTENPKVSEDTVFEYRKVLSNKGGFSDGELYFAEDYIEGAPLSQTYTDLPQVIRTVSKPLANSGSFADAQVFQFSKVINHGVGATDDINGVLPGDDQTFSFFKSIDQQAQVAETLERRVEYKRSFANDAAASSSDVLLVGKILANAAAAATNGSLRMQSYTEDMTYFAEDYVGTSLTF